MFSIADATSRNLTSENFAVPGGEGAMVDMTITL